MNGRIFASFLCALLLPGLVPTASAADFKLQYDLRVRGVAVGQARVDVGAAREQGGQRLRPIRIRAEVQPLGVRVLGVSGDGTSWLDASGQPVRGEWAWNELDTPARVQAQWENGKLDGRYFRGGEERRRIQHEPAGHSSDLLSLVPWLMLKRPQVGQTLRTTTFTGNQIYAVTARVRAAESTQSVIQGRRVVRLDGTAIRPGRHRQFKIWVDAETGLPLRLAFEHDLIGTVDALIRSEPGVVTAAP